MSFRDNLQHLRAERHMTQEQLAMLLGVSRQSVTKWEAEKSQPEMDKLLKLCDIFGCTLDELVCGDLANRTAPAAVTATSVPTGPPTDVCGYDEHWRRQARLVPAGIATVLAGIALGMLAEGRSPAWLGGDADTLMIALILLGVLVSLAFFIPAGMEHSAFKKAHPYVEDFYTERDRATARTALARALVAGIGVIFVGVLCNMTLGSVRETEQLGLFLLLLCIGAGAALIVRYGMLYGRTDVAEYNEDVAEDLEVEDIMAAHLDDAQREALLARSRRSKRLGAVCGAIMIVATIAGLCMLFVPPLMSPDPDHFNPMGSPTVVFWLAWPVGGLLCGLVSVIWNAFDKRG